MDRELTLRRIVSSSEVTVKDIRKCYEKIRSYTTYLGETRMTRKELLWSNLLAFFLDPGEIHELGELVLDAFLCAGKKGKWSIGSKKKVRVDREVPVKGGRMDIIVSWEDENGDGRAFAIENKIEAELNNPLEAYIEYLGKEYHHGNYRAFLLSPGGTKPPAHSGFTAISYPALAAKIRERLDEKRKENGNKGRVKWLDKLEDFIDTIDTNLDVKQKKPISKKAKEIKILRGRLNNQIKLLYGEYEEKRREWAFPKCEVKPDGESCSLIFHLTKEGWKFRVGVYLEDNWVYTYYCEGLKLGQKFPSKLLELLGNKGYPLEGGKIESDSKTMKDSRKDVLAFLKKFLPDFEEAIEKSLGKEESA